MSSLPTVRPSKPAVSAMSHSGAISRLTIGDRRSDMIKWALRRWLGKLPPNAGQIMRHIVAINEQNVGGENIPLEQRDIERVFEPKMEQEPEGQQDVSEFLHPDQN